MSPPFAILDFLDPVLGRIYVLLKLTAPAQKDLLKAVLAAILLVTVIAAIQNTFRAREKKREQRRKTERKHGMAKAYSSTAPLDRDEKRAYAETLLERGETLAAGRVFEELGQPSSAVVAYKKGRHWPELAQMYEKMKNYLAAAQFYQNAEMPREAAGAFQKGGDFLHAGEMFAKIEYYDKAGQAFEKAGRTAEAAKAYERWFLTATSPGDEGLVVLRRAASLYAQAGLHEKAIPLFERAGALAEAGHECIQTGESARAAELFLRAGKKREALEALRGTGERERILQLEAEVFSAEGAYEEAARRYSLLKDHYEAAELFKKCGKFSEAATEYVAGGYLVEAAESNVDAGNLERAQALYLRAGRPSQAAGLLAQLGRHLEAARLYEKGDDPFQGARAYLDAGARKEALETLSKLPRSHHQYSLAAPLLGHLLVEDGEYVQGRAVLSDFLAGQPVSPDTRQAYLDLACACDGLGEKTAYLEQLYRIHSLEPADLDIRSRIERCKGEIAEAGGSPKSTPPGISLGPPGAEGADLPPGLPKGELPRRYEVVEQLGEGGMGEVYKAKDLVLDRMVAIKFLRRLVQPTAQGGRLLREARAAARVNHPNIVTVYDVGVFEEIAYIVMEYVEGETVRSLLGRLQRVSTPQAIAIAAQTAAALAAAHAAGLIHRDVKPDNILLSTGGEAKLGDFGIANLREQVITGPAPFMGTVRYMSPEQIQGETIDGRSDLYSLGVTLYEMVTGAPPFAKGDVSYQHVHQPPTPPHERIPSIPPEVETLILRLLAKDPADRYPTADALREDLTAIRQRLGD